MTDTEHPPILSGSELISLLRYIGESRCSYIESASKHQCLWQSQLVFDAKSNSYSQLLNGAARFGEWFLEKRFSLTPRLAQRACLVISMSEESLSSNDIRRSLVQWVLHCLLARHHVICGMFTSEWLGPHCAYLGLRSNRSLLVLRTYLPKKDGSFLKKMPRKIVADFHRGTTHDIAGARVLLAALRMQTRLHRCPTAVAEWAETKSQHIEAIDVDLPTESPAAQCWPLSLERNHQVLRNPGMTKL